MLFHGSTIFDKYAADSNVRSTGFRASRIGLPRPAWKECEPHSSSLSYIAGPWTFILGDRINYFVDVIRGNGGVARGDT